MTYIYYFFAIGADVGGKFPLTLISVGVNEPTGCPLGSITAEDRVHL